MSLLDRKLLRDIGAMRGQVLTIALLVAAGVAVEPIRIDPYTHQRFTFFRDPDGLPLELYEVP